MADEQICPLHGTACTGGQVKVTPSEPADPVIGDPIKLLNNRTAEEQAEIALTQMKVQAALAKEGIFDGGT